MATGDPHARGIVASASLGLVSMLVLSGCSGVGGSGGSASAALDCGANAGKPATGEPIPLGALALEAPGLDFSSALEGVQAYFDCVNDNGGIDERPIEYRTYTDGFDPAQSAALATQLVENDDVIGMAGGASAMDCLANNDHYALKGIYVIGMALPDQCFSVSNFSPINSAPATTVPAAQMLVDAGVDKIVVVSSESAGIDQSLAILQQYADSVGVDMAAITEVVPVTDANGLAVRAVQEAGENGGVLMNMAESSLPVFQAAAAQALIDQVAWACTSACVSDSFAQSLGAAWEGRLQSADEFNLTSSDDPDVVNLRAVMGEYAPDTQIWAASISGFLSAQIAVAVLLGLPGDQITRESFNTALHETSGFASGLLCTPWGYGTGRYHMGNNAVRGVTPQAGSWIESAGCFDIAAVALNHLDEIRKASS